MGPKIETREYPYLRFPFYYTYFPCLVAFDRESVCRGAALTRER